MIKDKDDFKQDIVDALFDATRTEELSVERLYEIADQIAETLLMSANEVLKLR